ncbi:hypothetical protein [Luteimonas panaciterrae]|uniref:hypothetical protein n=1 Tax=Luteimonas panaciterrae TaxID=363885 RepID=UPI001CF992E6|nr:hypothetical protein [Luteimonas panaciterrae]
MIQTQERSVLDALHRITTDTARLQHTQETIGQLGEAWAAIDVAMARITSALAGDVNA